MPGKLVLENGLVLEGEVLGDLPIAVGKVVFYTGVVGYQEILTDPDYNGLIIIATYPEIGNYGVNNEDSESSGVQAAGFVIKNKSRIYSNFRATGSLDDFAAENKLPLLHNVETRQAVITIREEGEMLGAILPNDATIEDGKQAIAAYKKPDPIKIVRKIAVKEKTTLGSKNGSPKISLLDLGVKNSLLAQLEMHGCCVVQFPPETPPDEILKENPDAIILSNGPDDATGLDPIIANVKDLLGKKPILGVSLGSQVLGMALGGELTTLKCGHHGVNQPIKNFETGKVEITAHAHSCCVTAKSLEAAGARVTWENLNDKSVEAFEHKDAKAIGYQFCLSPPSTRDINPFLKEFLNSRT